MSELFTYGELGGVGGNSGPYPDARAPRRLDKLRSIGQRIR